MAARSEPVTCRDGGRCWSKASTGSGFQDGDRDPRRLRRCSDRGRRPTGRVAFRQSGNGSSGSDGSRDGRRRPGFADVQSPWIGHGPRRRGPRRAVGTKPSRSSTCWMVISRRTCLRSIPGMGHLEAWRSLASVSRPNREEAQVITPSVWEAASLLCRSLSGTGRWTRLAR